MRSIMLCAVTLMFLALPGLASAQSNPIPLSDPVITSMLNDPTSTQALADLGIITATTEGIVVDCEAGQTLMIEMDSLFAAAIQLVVEAGEAYHAAAGSDSATEEEVAELLAALEASIAISAYYVNLISGPRTLLQEILDAAGC